MHRCSTWQCLELASHFDEFTTHANSLDAASQLFVPELDPNHQRVDS
jgi:hypothetical protein